MIIFNCLIVFNTIVPKTGLPQSHFTLNLKLGQRKEMNTHKIVYVIKQKNHKIKYSTQGSRKMFFLIIQDIYIYIFQRQYISVRNYAISHMLILFNQLYDNKSLSNKWIVLKKENEIRQQKQQKKYNKT